MTSNMSSVVAHKPATQTLHQPKATCLIDQTIKSKYTLETNIHVILISMTTYSTEKKLALLNFFTI